MMRVGLHQPSPDPSPPFRAWDRRKLQTSVGWAFLRYAASLTGLAGMCWLAYSPERAKSQI